MSKFRFMKAGAFSALVTALLATSMPVQAQDRGDRSWGDRRAERQERSERREARRDNRGVERQTREVQARIEASRQARRDNYGAEGRNRSYGADTRREWRQEQRTEQRAERREDARESRRDFRQGYRAGQQQDWRDDRRNQRQAYHRGYRAGDRSDDRRWGGGDGRWDHRRWDSRGWRSDNRYDWYRYRAANRSIFRPGRYYAPSRGYSYSRLSIGFRLGSPFYSNRYWINDPWQYRLPPAYGSYRWVRYYDDALLVDTYSGQVVDLVHNFFW